MGVVVAVCGLPGSGKSYFASRLAERMNAVYFSSDRIRREMFKRRSYSDDEKTEVYKEMIRRARDHAAKPIVFDATFYRRGIRSLFREAFPGLVWIEVTAAEDIIRARLQKPRVDSEADLKVYHLIRSQWEPLEGEHLTLESTSDNIDDMLESAMQYLEYDR
ncbi:MAG TPA: ATP-binding protein [Cyclobacteriaceae bacterium]|nr:ATP-binding protein [Cyclobacteriaceae bacterium]